MSKTTEQVKEFLQEARSKGYTVSQRFSTVTISKWFGVGNKEQYIQCDMEAPHILSMVAVKKGYSSMWGTTGDGVGGHVALEQTGRFELYVSGVTNRFLKELAVQQITEPDTDTTKVDDVLTYALELVKAKAPAIERWTLLAEKNSSFGSYTKVLFVSSGFERQYAIVTIYWNFLNSEERTLESRVAVGNLVNLNPSEEHIKSMFPTLV